jgi:hypothetical protein
MEGPPTCFTGYELLIKEKLSSENDCFGRIPEIIRLVKVLQTTDKYGVAIPANWQSGDKVVVPMPKNKTEMDERLSEGYECKDWYLCVKKI